MSKPKHTPGPWTFESVGIARQVQFSSDALAISNGKHYHALLLGGDKTQAANARLISAAPEMLDALEHALADLEALGGRVSKIKAAIAKATGGAE